MATKPNQAVFHLTVDEMKFELHIDHDDPLYSDLKSTDPAVKAQAQQKLIKIAKEEMACADQSKRKTQSYCDVCDVWYSGPHKCPQAAQADVATNEPAAGNKSIPTTFFSKSATLLLINEFIENKEKVDKGIIKKKTFWEIIAKKLAEKGYSYTAEQVNGRWKSCVRAYKNIKDHNNKSGNDKKEYEFQKELDAIFGNDPIVQPVKVLTSGRKRKLDDDNAYNSDEDAQQQQINTSSELTPPSLDAVPSTSGTQCKTRSTAKDLTKVVSDYIQYQKDEKLQAVNRQKQMHSEKMQKFDSLIDVMTKMVEKK